MKIFLAYTLIVIGILAIIFYRSYSGPMIPYPFLIWVAGVALIAAGWYLLKRNN